jgi:LmbE family N-acetylglucosaminyl deacetylase
VVDDGSPKHEDAPFDVLMMHGATEDGGGAKVLRARPGRLDAGEVRPLKEGRPISGEVVRLERRQDAPALFDVHVEHEVKQHELKAAKTQVGPAQVATEAYRESWERIFGSRKEDAPN